MHRPTISLSALAASAAALLACATAPAGTPASPATGALPAVVSAACSTTTDLVVAATTDVHGRLRGWDYYADAPDAVRGLTRAATVVDSVRLANPGRVLLVDAGDLLQGNPLTYVAARVTKDTVSPVVAAMNVMKYDAAAIGNHEYNYGIPLLERAVRQSRFPFLSANTYRPDGSRAFPAFVVVERAGVKVGIVGATTPGVPVWDRDNVRGRLEFRDIVPEVRRAVADARAAGAEVVVAVLHSGLDEPSSYDTVSTGVPSENVAARVAREVRGIDLVVFGHSHKELAGRAIGTTLLLQPKNWATSVGVAHLAVAGCGGARHVIAERSATAVIPAAGHGESPAVLAITDAIHRETVAYATTPIGSTPVAWRGDSARVADTPIVDFILEVERAATGAQLASTAAFSLDAKLDAGPITVAELARLYPYDNTLRAVRIDGRQLREYLEHSARYYRTYVAGDTGRATDPEVPGYNFDVVAGADYTLDISKPIGSRVTRLEVNGRPVAPTDTFTMALNNYRQTGGGGFAMLRGAPLVYDKQQEIRQLLIDEVRRRGTIKPSDYFHDNWRLEPAAAVARAYSAGRREPGEGGASGSIVGAKSSRSETGSTGDAATSRAGAPDAEALGPRRAAIDPALAALESAPAPPSGTLPPRPGTVRLRIVSTNDFHGALDARPDASGVLLGGAGAVAAAIERARRECAPVHCETLVVDGGDMFQGTPASNLAFGRPVVAVYNRVGYAASALGNHEFDWGQDTLRALMKAARYDFLGANVRYTDGRDVPWVRNDTVVRRGPLTIGIIGVALKETAADTRAANTTGLRFDEAAPIVDSIARVLRRRGANAIVVLAHAGAFCSRSGTSDCSGEIIDLARNLTQPVDAIVSGHTHSLVDVAVRGIPIVQAYKSGRAIAVIDLDVPRRGSSARRRSGAAPDSTVVPRAEVRQVRTADYTPEPRVDSIARSAIAAVAGRVDAPVATIAEAMRKGKKGDQYALGNLLADAERWAAKTDISVMNNGGIRSDIRAGRATYGSLYEVLPFDNVIYKVTASGAAIRRYFELLGAGGGPDEHASGVQVTYDLSRPEGSRVVSIALGDGRPLADSATYTIALNDFMATGADGTALRRAARASENTNVSLLDALVDYLRTQPSPVVPPAGARLVVSGR
ncbi:MAG TPA: 5'-nucleotidase C-terminal domain-containing protein [Gemmatimonadaceae bacterium]|nr:5'-nucleotidase C-terminal domain-containing protein [Gemmatimonadaceae bacterium]